VSPDYFRVLKIPLKRGRFFTDRGRTAGADPIGQRIRLGSQKEGGPWFAIVGIVGDVRRYGLDRANLCDKNGRCARP
jgi:hypothetical protein